MSEGSGNDPIESGGLAVGDLEIIDQLTWWWGGWAALSFVALLMNLIFLIVVIKNRRVRDLRSFLTATLITLTVIDILDIARIIPSIISTLHKFEEFRLVYCTVGVFHTVGVAGLLLMCVFYLCCPCRDAPPMYYPASRCSGSLPQKLLLPLLLLVAGGAASLIVLLPEIHKDIVYYNTTLPHSCIDPLKARNLFEDENGLNSATFWTDFYHTVISIFGVGLPLVVGPPAIVVAMVRAAVAGHCCQAKYKQSAGEALMVVLVLIFYLGSIVGVVLPRLSKKIQQEEGGERIASQLAEVPVLWELANAAARPIIYFLCNPAVWEALKSLCGSNKNRYDDSTKEEEAHLSPVVERVSSL